MSSKAEEEAAADKDVCANCGIAEVDNIKLKILCEGGCDLVKYCGDKCREEHREQHHEECKKRANELHEKPVKSVYLHNPTVAIVENAQSVSCQCP
jgi:hypothetical protein